MRILQLSTISILTLSIWGCTATTTVDDSTAAEKRYSQADLDLMVENARAEERARMQKELNRQVQQKRVFDEILARQQQAEIESVTTTDVTAKPTVQSSIKRIQKIIPESRTPELYRVINDKSYYRCAANSLVAQQQKNGVWQYKPVKRELSATLCKKSRDKVTMLALQESLYAQDYLKSDTLSKAQLVDGLWGETTLVAVKKYQLAHGLLLGQMSIETLEHIGVFAPRNVAPEDTMLGVNSIQPVKLPLEPAQAPDVSEEGQPETETAPSSEQKLPETTVAEVETLAVAQTKNEIESQELSVAKADKAEVELVKAQPEAVEVTEQLESTAEKTDSSVPVEQVQLVKVVNKIVPTSRKPKFYQKVGGASYFRCAANALVPQKQESGKWMYGDQKELSATLCKMSRDEATMTDLQYELYEKGYLRDGDTPKGVLVDGTWGTTTLEAVKKYQETHGLLYGQLTIEMLEHLGIFEPTADRVVMQKTPQDQKVVTTNTDMQETTEELAEQSVEVVAENAQNEIAVNEVEKRNDTSEMPVETPATTQASVVAKASAEVSEPVSAEVVGKPKVDEVKFVALKIKPANPDFDASAFVPRNSKPQLYAYVNRFKLWRCGARSILPETSQNGEVVYGERKQYRATLCKQNRTIPLMTRLQTALRDAGYLTAPVVNQTVKIDGVWDVRTLDAVKAYQKANALPYGQLTIETLEHLGVFIKQ